jgi:transitional endoplasmic reticulum ATPase
MFGDENSNNSKTLTTQKPVTVTLETDRKKSLDDLVNKWSMDQKKFVLSSLGQYSPIVKSVSTVTYVQKIKDFFFGKEPEQEEEEKKISNLSNEKIFYDLAERYKITGEHSPRKAIHKLFNNELTSDDRTYLTYVLNKDTDDVYVPRDLVEEIKIGHKRFHQNLLQDGAPKAPFYLVIGPTGSGKTKTINAAIHQALFDGGIEVKPKVDDELKIALKEHPIMARIDLASINPELAERLKEVEHKKRVIKYSKWPLLKYFYKDEMVRLMEEFEEEDEEFTEFGMNIDLGQINPNNVQTMWYGETGNKMMKSFGSKGKTSIRILEEAHALWSVHESRGAQVQEDTLVSTANIILDEVQKGERPCMVFALTRKGEEFHEDLYRRFVEKGRIIDMGEYWRNPKTIEELVKIELIEQNLQAVSINDLHEISNKILNVFQYRGLDVTPAYVRKLVASISEEKKELKAEFFDDGVLVRKAFVNVARNLYSEMFRKTYNKLQRGVEWNDYVGDDKEEFQRLANQCLRYGLATDKGVVLAGPPGSGKTYLARTFLSRHKDISDVTLKMEHLQDKNDPIDGPVRRLAQAFDIAKMCAPTLLFVDEGEAVAMERTGNITDKITNKLLNAIDGETELKGVFTVLTTNKPEHLAEAATRSKRLKVMPISGKLTERDIYRMLDNNFSSEKLSSDLNAERIYSVSRKICSTPADYSSFFETIINYRNEESKIIEVVSKLDEKNLEEFVVSNYKALLGVVESLDFHPTFVQGAKKDATYLIEHRGELLDKVRFAAKLESYPVTLVHLERAKEDRVKAPQIQGKINLDDYLQSQLPKEPIKGVVIGAGASETSGTLVPISTSLIFDPDYTGDKVVVTGAVSIDSPQAAQMNAAVEMMKQSSSEALSLVLNYLESLIPEKDVKRIIGKYLEGKHFHHQFLTANYHSGGPSAGMALAINTLSEVLDLKVKNDFGITGAAWSRGKTQKDVGSVVIIGGTYNKAQIVLSYLNRMYVPEQNLKDLDFLTLQNYWDQGKDVIGYQSFPSIVGEVYQWDNELDIEVNELFIKRIGAKQQELIAASDAELAFHEVENFQKSIRNKAEYLLKERIQGIEKYLTNGGKDGFQSLDSIFQKKNF